MANVFGFELLYAKDVFKDDALFGIEGQLFLGDTLCGGVKITGSHLAKDPIDFNPAKCTFEFDFPPTALFELETAVRSQLAHHREPHPNSIEELCAALATATVLERARRAIVLMLGDETEGLPQYTVSSDSPVVCPAMVELRRSAVEETGLLPEMPTALQLTLAQGLKSRRAVDAISYVLEDRIGFDLGTTLGKVVLDQCTTFEVACIKDEEGRDVSVAQYLAGKFPELETWADSRYTRLIPVERFDGETANMLDANTGAIVRVGQAIAQAEGLDSGSLGCRLIRLADGTCAPLPGVLMHFDSRPTNLVEQILFLNDVSKVFDHELDVTIEPMEQPSEAKGERD